MCVCFFLVIDLFLLSEGSLLEDVFSSLLADDKNAIFYAGKVLFQTL